MKTMTNFYKSSVTGLVVLAAMLLLPVTAALAQGGGDTGGGTNQPNTNRVGTSGANELLVPLTARYAALGNSMTSVLSDMNGLEALYANPAGLAVNPGTSALFSRLQYVDDIGVNYFGLAQRIGENHLALAISSWDFGELVRQTEINPEKGEATFSVAFINLGLTYARQLTDRIAAGATLKIVNESIDDLTATGLVFDAGMTYVVGETGLRLGVALKNIGNELTYSGTGLGRRVQLPNQPSNATVNTVAIESEGMQYPTLLNFGMSYTRSLTGAAEVSLIGHFRSNSFEEDQFSGGMEIGIRNVLYLRGGYEWSRQDNETWFQGYSLGAGLNMNVGGSRLTLDYALVPTDFFDDIQFITLSATL